MNIKKLLESDLEPQVGETRLINGHLSMCICSWAHHGGGSGPLWATENKSCLFSTKKIKGLFKGVCKKVHPKDQSISIHITKGNAWGFLVEGTNVRIYSSQIEKYIDINDEIDAQELLEESDKIIKEVELNNRFKSITIQELRNDIPDAYIKGFNKLIGLEDYKKFEDLIRAYEKITREVEKADSLVMFYKEQKIRNAGDQFRLKLESFIREYNIQRM